MQKMSVLLQCDLLEDTAFQSKQHGKVVQQHGFDGESAHCSLANNVLDTVLYIHTV